MAEKKRKRTEASNAGKYKCPLCTHMIGNRDLSICMTCMAGDKFEARKIGKLE